MAKGSWDGTRFEAFEREGWAERGPTYDRGFGLMTAGVHGALLDAARVGEGTRMLEVGCGTGRLSAAALGRGAEIVATDAVPEMAAIAAAALPGGTVRTAALPSLPFPDGAFDAVVGAFVVNHVADPPAAVAELARVTAPGGRISLSCWDAATRNRAQGVFFDAAAEAGASTPAGVPANAPFLAYSGPERFTDLLRGAGLHGVRVEPSRWTHQVDPDRWWHDVLAGTVLTSALVRLQDPATVTRIRAAYDRLVAGYGAGCAEDRDDGAAVVRLPAAALVATGVR